VSLKDQPNLTANAFTKTRRQQARPAVKAAAMNTSAQIAVKHSWWNAQISLSKKWVENLPL
jgi:hypothetical protein